MLLNDRETGIQNMLDILSDWCKNNEMVVNNQKSNVLHFRPPSVGHTNYNFRCGDAALNIVEKYNYLGLVLNEFLDCSTECK